MNYWNVVIGTCERVGAMCLGGLIVGAALWPWSTPHGTFRFFVILCAIGFIASFIVWTMAR